MEIELLKIINEELNKIVSYEYCEYKGELKYPYAVGEYNETGVTFEDNATTGEFILTLFNRGKEIDLIKIKEKIKDLFIDYRIEKEIGTFYINFRNKLFIQSDEEDLKKMEIYLDIKYWKGASV